MGREPQPIADDALDTHTESRATYGPHGSIQPVAAYAAAFILGYRARDNRRWICRSGARWRDYCTNSPRNRVLRAGTDCDSEMIALLSARAVRGVCRRPAVAGWRGVL